MNAIINTQKCFRTILGTISVEELTGNKKLIEKINEIHSLFIQLAKRRK